MGAGQGSTPRFPAFNESKLRADDSSDRNLLVAENEEILDDLFFAISNLDDKAKRAMDLLALIHRFFLLHCFLFVHSTL